MSHQNFNSEIEMKPGELERKMTTLCLNDKSVEKRLQTYVRMPRMKNHLIHAKNPLIKTVFE